MRLSCLLIIIQLALGHPNSGSKNAEHNGSTFFQSGKLSYENFDGTQMQENESSESEIHVITSYTNLDPKYL